MNLPHKRYNIHAKEQSNQHNFNNKQNKNIQQQKNPPSQFPPKV